MLVYLDTCMMGLLIWQELKIANSITKFAALIFLFFMPWNSFFQDDLKRNLILAVLTILWMAFRKTNKIIVLAIFVSILIYWELKLNSILGSGWNLDSERTIVSDGKFVEIINKFADDAVFITYRLRHVLFNNWILVSDLLSRTLNGMWFDKFINVLGLPGAVICGWGIFKRLNFRLFAPVLIGVGAGMLSRNPDYATMYYLLLPVLITLYCLGLSEIEKWLNIK